MVRRQKTKTQADAASDENLIAQSGEKRKKRRKSKSGGEDWPEDLGNELFPPGVTVRAKKPRSTPPDFDRGVGGLDESTEEQEEDGDLLGLPGATTSSEEDDDSDPNTTASSEESEASDSSDEEEDNDTDFVCTVKSQKKNTE